MAMNTNVTTVDPTVAQLGLAIGQMNQKIQQLTAAQAASTATTNVAVASTASASSTTVPETGVYAEVNPVQPIITSAAACSWTTLNLSAYVNSTTTRVVLNGYFLPSSTAGELDFRSASGAITRMAAQYSGTYPTGVAFNLEVPLSPSLTIDYQLTATLAQLTVNLIELYQ